MKELQRARMITAGLAVLALLCSFYVFGNIVLVIRYKEHRKLVGERLDQRFEEVYPELAAKEAEVNREWNALFNAELP